MVKLICRLLVIHTTYCRCSPDSSPQWKRSMKCRLHRVVRKRFEAIQWRRRIWRERICSTHPTNSGGAIKQTNGEGRTADEK